jgi:hypothetical protein
VSTTSLVCSLGSFPVNEGFLRLPLRGNWSAQIECTVDPEATEPAIGSAAQLVVTPSEGAPVTFSGVIRRGGVHPGASLLRVSLAGGAGRLLTSLPPREYIKGAAAVPAGLIARDAATAAGETLDDGVETLLDAIPLDRWTRCASTAKEAIDRLASDLGLGWRVLPSGKIKILSETWAAVDDVAERLTNDPEDGIATYAPDGAVLFPGATIDGRRAIEVQYVFGGTALRALVRVEVPGDPSYVLAPGPYGLTWSATVVSQRDDGTLDLKPDAGGVLPDLLAVPLDVGLPGCKVTVPEGQRVSVRFVGGSPKAARAFAPEQDPAANKALALVGDNVEGGWLSGVVSGASVILTFSPGFSPPSPAAGAVYVSGIISGPGHKYIEGVAGS